MVTKVENALMWLYVKTWENLGQHVIDQDQMWNFGEKDLKEAIIGRDPRTLAGRSPSRWWSGPRRNFGIRGPSRPTRTGTKYFCVTTYLKGIRSRVDSHKFLKIFENF